MKKLFILLTFTFLVALVYGQDSLKKTENKNAISFEALGNGGLFSFNYERKVLQRNTYYLSSRYGITYLPNIKGFNDEEGPGFIFELNSLFGKSKNKLELGLGVNFAYFHNKYDKHDKKIIIYTTPRIGYKYESEKKYFFRIGFTPIVLLKVFYENRNHDSSNLKGILAAPWIGIGIGKMF